MLDTNVFVRSVIARNGAAAELLDLVMGGFVDLVVSPRLLDEIEQVLMRRKFRRHLTEDEVHDLIDALILTADSVADRPDDLIPKVCRDPKDDYLVAVFEDGAAHILVSDDNDVLHIEHAGLDARTTAEAMHAIRYRHPWGAGYLPGSAGHALQDAETHGADAVIRAASTFLAVLQERDAKRLLPLVVVPESLRAWRRDLRLARRQLANRGMTSRPHFESLDTALVKLPPDPGDNVRVAGSALLPPDTAILIMRHCHDLDDPPGLELGKWRAFGYRLIQ